VAAQVEMLRVAQLEQVKRRRRFGVRRAGLVRRAAVVPDASLILDPGRTR